MTIAIDLGTTTSLVACMEEGQVRIIPNRRGQTATPSCVALDRRGDVLVGQPARNALLADEARGIAGIKRSMGVRGTVAVGEWNPSPEEVSATILGRLRADAWDALGREPYAAVITVPAAFDDRQRAATVEAGLLAGFREVALVNEPTAAAIAYAARDRDVERVLVFDFGGGTIDVTCLERTTEGVRVLSSVGRNDVGGADIDAVLLDVVAREIEVDSGRDPTSDPRIRPLLLELVERAKWDLSDADHALIAVPFVAGTSREIVIERAEFDALIRPIVERAIAVAERAVAEAGVPIDAIERILFAGGSSRVALVRESVSERFPIPVAAEIDPQEVVVRGAALYASHAFRTTMVVHDLLSATLALELADGSSLPMVERNAPLPARAERRFTTATEGQRAAEIHLVQGDSPRAAENRSLGRIVLDGLSDEPVIDVRIGVTDQGLVRVFAEDSGSGVRRELAVVPSIATSDTLMGSASAYLISLTRRLRALRVVADAEMQDEIAAIVELLDGGGDPVEEMIPIVETLIADLLAVHGRKAEVFA